MVQHRGTNWLSIRKRRYYRMHEQHIELWYNISSCHLRQLDIPPRIRFLYYSQHFTAEIKQTHFHMKIMGGTCLYHHHHHSRTGIPKWNTQALKKTTKITTSTLELTTSLRSIYMSKTHTAPHLISYHFHNRKVAFSALPFSNTPWHSLPLGEYRFRASTS